MKKLTDEHANSLKRAITILKMAMNRQDVPKYKREFKKDIGHLNEIADQVDFLIHTPMFDNILNEPCELVV